MQNQARMSVCKGFTLIELLVVIAIIGVLTSLLTANFIGVRQRASDGRKKGDLLQIKSALEVYRSDQAGYPTTLPACGSPLRDSSNNVTYMQKIPCESTGVPYQYSNASDGRIYCLRTCLENTSDVERDEVQFGENNPGQALTGCDGLTNCPSDKVSFTLQNP